jgi:tetratricopeptide (TPR) repeat protein
MSLRRPFSVLSLLGLFVVVSLAGCVSTKERYERVQSLSSEGRTVAAAYEMIEVLDDDSSWPNGRRELLKLASTAFDTLMTEARQLRRDDRPVEAVGRLNEVDRLHDACQRVKVSVPLPEGYASVRRETESEAYAMLVDRGEAAFDAEDWPDAEAAFEEARAYADGTDQLRELDRLQARTLFRWADAEMQRSAYRSAYDKAEAVTSLLSEDAALVEDARTLQQAALDRGTRRVAFLPLWQTESAGQAMPPGFQRELNETLRYRHWDQPPLFIASADPLATRRTLQRMGLDRTVLSRRQAVRAGERLDADYLVTGEVVQFVAEKSDVEQERRVTGWTSNARGATRGRPDDGPTADTAYVVEDFDLKLTAGVEFRVVDVRSGRIVATRTVDVSSEGEMRRGVFEGDWRNLDLSGSELALFDPEEIRRREQALETSLADALADALAREAFDRILGRID